MRAGAQDNEAVAINLDIEPIEKPQTVYGSIQCIGIRMRRSDRVAKPRRHSGATQRVEPGISRNDF